MEVVSTNDAAVSDLVEQLEPAYIRFLLHPTWSALSVRMRL